MLHTPMSKGRMSISWRRSSIRQSRRSRGQGINDRGAKENQDHREEKLLDLEVKIDCGKVLSPKVAQL